jgi:hypothetical protein
MLQVQEPDHIVADFPAIVIMRRMRRRRRRRKKGSGYVVT